MQVRYIAVKKDGKKERGLETQVQKDSLRFYLLELGYLKTLKPC